MLSPSKLDQNTSQKVLREWLSTQDSYVKDTVSFWRNNLTKKIRNLGELSADELILKVLLYMQETKGDKWDNPLQY